MKDNLTQDEEEELLKRLSSPPKCMHGDMFRKPDVEDLDHSWRCRRCGLIAKKIVIPILSELLEE